MRIIFYQALNKNNNTLSTRHHVDAFQQSKALMNHQGFILMRAYYYSFIRHDRVQGELIFRQILNSKITGTPESNEILHFEIIHSVKHNEKLGEMLEKFHGSLLRSDRDWVETLFVARDLRKNFHLIPSTHKHLKVLFHIKMVGLVSD